MRSSSGVQLLAATIGCLVSLVAIAEDSIVNWKVPGTRPDQDPVAMWQLQQTLIELAEKELGPRDSSKKIYQPSFERDGPRLRNTPSLDGAFAELSPNAQGYWPTAVYELAHETVHLLNPSVGVHATVLEEGMAVEFAVQAQRMLGLTPQSPESGPYLGALRAVRMLPGPPLELGQRIRRRHGSLKGAVEDDLEGVAPSVAASLLAPFGPSTFDKPVP